MKSKNIIKKVNEGDNMMKLNTSKEVNEFISNNEMALLYFSSKSCSVCVGMFPKVEEMLKSYPNIKSANIDVDKSTEAAGQHLIFSLPAILVYVNGKETIRKARIISMLELEKSIKKYYDLIFNY
ncbi:thioredoxin family protein [Clostridium sp. JN-9]|uniref:thioredoxin family protein n=1 Tax=Clostridium sp. JN-9 TaxID=2507159 RepID=UPI001FA98FCE|nr:thioredoxin family protein [Clostridium sp. JN-9]